MGVERSEVGRRKGENEAEAMKECENERVSGVEQIMSLVVFYNTNNC